MDGGNRTIAKVPFAERLRRRRRELRFTHEQLRAATGPTESQQVSVSTIKNMENVEQPYALPQRRSSKDRPMPLELVAKALDVPLGYFLAGFSPEEVADSYFGEAVRAGHIPLVEDLRPPAPDKETLSMFIERLPESEEEIFNLPLYSFQNERALAVIFAIERIYSGYEMLIVNEPPFVLWDEDDVEAWADGMSISVEDYPTFRRQFTEYRSYFRNLIEQDKKNYKVVVNYPTLKRFLDRKGATARHAWLLDAERLLRHKNFNFIIHRPRQDAHHYVADAGAHECEVLCKTKEIPLSREGMVACQILQTPPHVKPTSYIVSPAPRDAVMVQREMSRVDAAWAEALLQYQEDLGSAEAFLVGDDAVRRHTIDLIRSI